MSNPKHLISVADFGARGDGVTDDTESIQAAINHVFARGGGTVFFPFAPGGYRIAKPAAETVDGKACRSQLYIPSSRPVDDWRSICLEGEVPVIPLRNYQMRDGQGRWPATEFPLPMLGSTLISDWDAPENRDDPNARPWSLISVLDSGHPLPFGLGSLTVRQLEFRVKLDTEKLYPTCTAANFRCTSCLVVEHCYFGLSRNVASFSTGKSLAANPCHCAGLIASDDQNDHQAFRSVGVQGFKYGFVFGEHTVADYLYVHNCEEAIVFHDSSHFSHIHHVVAQHNRSIVSALRQPTFELQPSMKIYFQIDSIDFEPGWGQPDAYVLEHGVYDPDDRMHARIMYHGVPVTVAFPVCGGKHVQVGRFM